MCCQMDPVMVDSTATARLRVWCQTATMVSIQIMDHANVVIIVPRGHTCQFLVQLDLSGRSAGFYPLSTGQENIKMYLDRIFL